MLKVDIDLQIKKLREVCLNYENDYKLIKNTHEFQAEMIINICDMLKSFYLADSIKLELLKNLVHTLFAFLDDQKSTKLKDYLDKSKIISSLEVKTTDSCDQNLLTALKNADMNNFKHHIMKQLNELKSKAIEKAKEIREQIKTKQFQDENIGDFKSLGLDITKQIGSYHGINNLRYSSSYFFNNLPRVPAQPLFNIDDLVSSESSAFLKDLFGNWFQVDLKTDAIISLNDKYTNLKFVSALGSRVCFIMKESIRLINNPLGQRDFKLPNGEEINSVGLSDRNVFIETKKHKLYGFGTNHFNELGHNNNEFGECINITDNKKVKKIVPFSAMTFVLYEGKSGQRWEIFGLENIIKEARASSINSIPNQFKLWAFGFNALDIKSVHINFKGDEAILVYGRELLLLSLPQGSSISKMEKKILAVLILQKNFNVESFISLNNKHYLIFTKDKIYLVGDKVLLKEINKEQQNIIRTYLSEGKISGDYYFRKSDMSLSFCNVNELFSAILESKEKSYEEPKFKEIKLPDSFDQKQEVPKKTNFM